MLPDLQFSVLCDDVRQEHNGKFILLGVFEAIQGKQFTVTHPMLHVANRWCNGQGEFTERTRIVSAQNEVIAESAETRFSLEDTMRSYTVIGRFTRVSFPAAGNYWVEILLNDDLNQRYPLVLLQAK